MMVHIGLLKFKVYQHFNFSI